MEIPSSSELYLYGIIPTGENIIFNVPWAGAEIIDVFTVPIYYPLSASPREQGIAGVVSASPYPDFNNRTREEMHACQVKHQQVISTVTQFFPILPVRCGTTFACELEVSEFLSQHNLEIQIALQRIHSRADMEINFFQTVKV